MLILPSNMLGRADDLHFSLSSGFTWQKAPQGQLVLSSLKAAELRWECIFTSYLLSRILLIPWAKMHIFKAQPSLSAVFLNSHTVIIIFLLL